MKILSIITVILIVSSCAKQKEIRIIGFAYKGDNIILHAEKNNDFTFTVNEREYKDKICSFNEKIKLYNDEKGLRVNIVIDSSNVKLLDTLVIIPKNYKQPFISFLYPSVETNFGRELFIADEASFNKY